jgi:hypothetical protein
MQQLALFTALEGLGYSVKSFEYHPNFFGNWKADLCSKNHDLYISSDRREGWLTLWRYETSAISSKLFEVESSRMNDQAELQTLQGWLVNMQ